MDKEGAKAERGYPGPKRGTHQGAACDVASVHFSMTISGTDILVYSECKHPLNMKDSFSDLS